MMIMTNAWKSITRSKGRNILIGIIILTIAISASIALAIRSAADKAKETGLAAQTITGTISVDRQKLIDFSENSIHYAKQSAEILAVSVDYRCQDYLSIDLGENCYDLIFLIYCDFGVLSATEQTELLRNVYRALKPEGYFVFDVFTPQKYTDFLPRKDWRVEVDNFWTKDCCLHLQKNSHYPKTATYLEQHLLLYANDYKEFYIWETVFTSNELSKELEKAMFSSVEVYADICGEKWTKDSETACFVAKK